MVINSKRNTYKIDPWESEQNRFITKLEIIGKLKDSFLLIALAGAIAFTIMAAPLWLAITITISLVIGVIL